MTERVLLGHGGGGTLTHDLVERVFRSRLDNPLLAAMDDAAVMEVPAGRLAFTTDSFVVDPLFFDGGDAGVLAVSGTVNDLAAMGARPWNLTAAFIIEEGFPVDLLERLADSMARTARQAGVAIVAGDTKVVPRGQADGVFITTAGVGIVPLGRSPSGRGAQPGDRVIISGPPGQHGLAIMMGREGAPFSGGVQSDVAPLNGLVEAAYAACGPEKIHAMRDPTRGGAAAVLNEIAAASACRLELLEESIPRDPAVEAACDLLGLDSLYLANEGKMVFVVAAEAAADVLDSLQRHERGRQAAEIGLVRDDAEPRVVVRTPLGSGRILDMPVGELLPRIC